MTGKEKIELKDDVINIFNRFNTLDNTATIGGLRDNILRYIDSLQEEPVSEDLEEAANFYANTHTEWFDADNNPHVSHAFKAGAQWQKKHLWKLANGNDLPEIDREVVVLEGIIGPTTTDCFYGYKVVFAHRPDPKGWDAKSIITEKVEHYTPKTYGKGGWNIPNIVYWLDIELPKEI